jgi:hypothetical protein
MLKPEAMAAKHPLDGIDSNFARPGLIQKDTELNPADR